MDSLNIGFIILSLFCAGGLFAYVRETVRLRRLMASGTEARATVRKKEKKEAGSESVVHYLVTYEFIDSRGNTITREEDVNSLKFFNGLNVGDTMQVIYQRDLPANSYPIERVQADLDVSRMISLTLLLIWVGMGTFFIL